MGNSVKSLKIFTKKVRSAPRFFILLQSPHSWCMFVLRFVPKLTDGYLTGSALTEPVYC